MAGVSRFDSFAGERQQIGDHMPDIGAGESLAVVIGHGVGVTIHQMRPWKDDRLIEILLGAERWDADCPAIDASPSKSGAVRPPPVKWQVAQSVSAINRSPIAASAPANASRSSSA